MYGPRIQQFEQRVSEMQFNPRAQSTLLSTLAFIRALDDALSDMRYPASGRDTFPGAVNPALEALPAVLRSEDLGTATLEWCRTLLASIDKYLEGLDEDGYSVAEIFRGDANALIQQAALHLDDAKLRREARALVEEASTAAEAAKDAAGIAGGASLSEHFQHYARGERLAANAFRIATILVIASAAIVALVWGHPDPDDWAGTIYRLALLAGIGGLSAYLGRQAGQHRRMFNWAKSMDVQLKSFPAFMQPIPEDERGEIYRAFARRVLGAPPEKGVEGADDVSASQLAEMVTILLKRDQQ